MLKVYNTMSRQKEPFKPLEEGKVSIYCCGVTPYNHPHIGNARPFVTWDVIRRYFSSKGYQVRYIQNFTDVDDKIIRTAKEEGLSWSDISGRYIKAYFEAMDALNVRHADVYPRVSETIPDIIRMVQTLVDKGYAYAVENGDVFYSVENLRGMGNSAGASWRICRPVRASRWMSVSIIPWICALESCQAGRAELGEPVGKWTPGLAY